jgi:hypothetical protein
MTEPTIWKFEIPITDETHLAMPMGAQILTVLAPMSWGHGIRIYATVLPDAPLVSRIFYVVGTGNPMVLDEPIYLGTVEQGSGRFVWHVFDGGEYTSVEGKT